MKKFIFSKVAGSQAYSQQLQLQMNPFTGTFQGFYLDFTNIVLSPLAQATSCQILKGPPCSQHLWETLMLMVLMPNPSVIMHLICDNN